MHEDVWAAPEPVIPTIATRTTTAVARAMPLRRSVRRSLIVAVVSLELASYSLEKSIV